MHRCYVTPCYWLRLVLNDGGRQDYRRVYYGSGARHMFPLNTEVKHSIPLRGSGPLSYTKVTGFTVVCSPKRHVDQFIRFFLVLNTEKSSRPDTLLKVFILSYLIQGFLGQHESAVTNRYAIGLSVFTARCYASAVLAMGLCPCLSVCHKPVFY